MLEREAELDEDSDEGFDPRPEAVIRISQAKLVAERLMVLLGFDVEEFFPDGKVSLKKEVRGNLERAYRERNNGQPHPFFLMYDLWSKRQKQASTYGRKFLWARHPLTGAIHPTLRIAGTDTGRYSSNRPNVLNIPAAKEAGDPDFRGAFIAPDGMLLLGADFEAMEFRIAVNVTHDRTGKKMVEGGKDGHTFTAAMMFHIRKANVTAVRKVQETFKYGTSVLDVEIFEVPENWTTEQIAEFALTDEAYAVVEAVKKKTTRTVAKMVTFLWLFRGTPYTLAVRTGLPEEQCKEFFTRFNTVYADMAAGMDALADAMLRNVIEGNDGRLYAWSGAYGGLRRWFELPENPSRRDYPDGWAGESKFKEAQRDYKRRLRSIQREGCNVPMQGGNAMVTAQTLNRLVEEGFPMKVFPFLAIYDEVIMVFPETVKPTVVKEMLETAMLETANEYMTFVPAGAEADLSKVSRVWVKS